MHKRSTTMFKFDIIMLVKILCSLHCLQTFYSFYFVLAEMPNYLVGEQRQISTSSRVHIHPNANWNTQQRGVGLVLLWHKYIRHMLVTLKYGCHVAETTSYLTTQGIEQLTGSLNIWLKKFWSRMKGWIVEKVTSVKTNQFIHTSGNLFTKVHKIFFNFK